MTDWKLIILIFVCYEMQCTCAQTFLSVRGKNLTLNGEKVFLSGLNQAWYIYGADFGKTYYAVSKPHLVHTLNAIQASGGNSIRIWLHINGINTPMFNTSGHVIGLDPNITRDLRDFLQEAQSRNILVTISLWNCASLHQDFPLYGLLMDDSKLKSYIDNALIPMVTALRSERGLGIWEIINEPEGCMLPGVKDDKQPCYDTSTLHFYDFPDWTDEQIPIQRLLYFISLQSSAIHMTDPKALVTVGSWEYKSITDQLDRRNLYSDHCLQFAAGGLPTAKLDLYQIHTYQTLIIYLPHDPFMVDASKYKSDKPIIIGEFSQKKGGFLTSQEQFTWAYYHGYSGAWSWSALGSDDAADSLEVQEKGIGSLKNKNDQTKGGRVNIDIRDKNFLKTFVNFVYSYITQWILTPLYFFNNFGVKPR